MKNEKPKLRRERHPMPDFVLKSITRANLLKAYESRPPYQQNDYIGWITQAKRKETREARLAQMLDELRRGDAYMKMAYRPKWLEEAARRSKEWDENPSLGVPGEAVLRELRQKLIGELDAPAGRDVEKTWIVESEHRYAAFQRGELEALPGDEVMARVRQRIK